MGEPAYRIWSLAPLAKKAFSQRGKIANLPRPGGDIIKQQA